MANNSKQLFQKLYPGSSFNFISSLLEQYSLFQFEAITPWILLEVEVDEIKNLSHQDHKLFDVLGRIKSEISIQGKKYDYSYWNILKRQQSIIDGTTWTVKMNKPFQSKFLSMKVNHQQFQDLLSDSKYK